MPILTRRRLQLEKPFSNLPLSVSNFSKAIASITLTADNSFNNGRMTISLFEATRNGGNMVSSLIASKVFTITSGDLQDFSAEFPKNNTSFPGNSVFQHFYFAVFAVRKTVNGRDRTMATSVMTELPAALLIAVGP
jgi:hypothetical protein